MKYELNDICLITVGDPASFNCSHRVGDGFECKGENIIFNEQTKFFSHYVLATLIPYIAAKQRVEDQNDWMLFEKDIACPDPRCGAIFQFSITGKSRYEYSANESI